VPRRLYLGLVVVAAAALVGLGAPSWLALVVGLAIALGTGATPPKHNKKLTTYALQLGVVALGAGMNLVTVWQVGSSGALLTAAGLATALAIGLVLGRLLKVPGDTPLLIAVGTAICGGSAIAAVASVIKPKEHEMSVALAVVFILNAVGLIVFPPIGHALGMTETEFGRWAALAIHDTSSVVGAGLAYGGAAVGVATTTKLARALWIVPITLAIAVTHREPGGSLKKVKWPWFILGFVAVAALVTWVPDVAPAAQPIEMVGRRLLVLALFLIGLSLSRASLAKVGPRSLILGVVLWIIIATAAVPLATAV